MRKIRNNNITITMPWLIITFIILLVGKLAGWASLGSVSWWWITCPLWGPFAITAGIFTFVVLLMAIGCVIYGLYVLFIDR